MQQEMPLDFKRLHNLPLVAISTSIVLMGTLKTSDSTPVSLWTTIKFLEFMVNHLEKHSNVKY